MKHSKEEMSQELLSAGTAVGSSDGVRMEAPLWVRSPHSRPRPQKDTSAMHMWPSRTVSLAAEPRLTIDGKTALQRMAHSGFVGVREWKEVEAHKGVHAAATTDSDYNAQRIPTRLKSAVETVMRGWGSL